MSCTPFTWRRQVATLAALAAFAMLPACGGSPGTAKHAIAGTVTGLLPGNSLVLTNDGDSVTVSADGRFSFARQVSEGQAYRVELAVTTPTAQPCASTYGIGTMGEERIDNVTVICGLPGGTATFVAAQPMGQARHDATATLLADGKVLVSHGQTHSRDSSAELYDPTNGRFTATGDPTARRVAHTATRLLDGRVLVVGGADWGNFVLFAETSAELYDPATGLWTRTGDMDTARKYHTATLLPDGKVLVTGGTDVLGRTLRGAELYDPATGRWKDLPTMRDGRWRHSAVLLPGGKVLVSGGVDAVFPAETYVASSELFDPQSGQWSASGPMLAARGGHTATLLPSGQVLVAGGHGAGAACELYDPVTRTWSAAAALASPRSDHTATLLPSGRVLVAAGVQGHSEGTPRGALATAELFDPSSGRWTGAGPLAQARWGHRSTLLTNGKLLVTGGLDDQELLSSAELFH